MLVIQPPVIFSIFTQHLIRIFALEVFATRFDLIGAPPSPSCRSCLVYSWLLLSRNLRKSRRIPAHSLKA